MQTTRQILILTAKGMVAEAIKDFLEEKMALTCRTLEEPDIGHFGTIGQMDLALLLPETWQQLPHWLPSLHKACPSCPWLVMGDFCIAGMYLSWLQQHPCSLLSPHAPREEVQAAMEILTSGRATPPFPTLLSLFVIRAMTLSQRSLIALPSHREFEVGCAASLRLTTSEMAQALYIDEKTVISHLNHLFQKLGISHRHELAACFERALALDPPTI